MFVPSELAVVISLLHMLNVKHFKIRYKLFKVIHVLHEMLDVMWSNFSYIFFPHILLYQYFVEFYILITGYVLQYHEIHKLFLHKKCCKKKESIEAVKVVMINGV